ncbi:MAG: hypothetical protein U0133_10865 [Gemmatimonadales bacterium]
MHPEPPDHHDAELILKIYDLRREAVLRESRAQVLKDYWPTNVEEAVVVYRMDHPLNRAWRQMTSYWEMVYGMARHGAIHPEFLVDNNGEGLVLFVRAEPYLAAIREASSPRSFRNAEWVARETETGRAMIEGFRARYAKAIAAR